MLVADFDYYLPDELIAQTAVEPRDHAKLLVYNKTDDSVEHRQVFNLVDYLKSGDVLVINNSKVFPARLHGKRQSSGAEVEVFLIHQIESKKNCWQVLVKMNRPKKDDLIIFGNDFSCRLNEVNRSSGVWEVEFTLVGDFWDKVNKYGQTPLPPYIHQVDNEKIRQRYQTVYAKVSGSVAAPTAGLHLTDELIKKLKDKDVEIAQVTLHVGLGTFQSVKTEAVEEHHMHAEWASIEEEAVELINGVKRKGGRVVAVGTTAVRVLEAWSDDNGLIKEKQGWLNIFIYPGYIFKCVDCLLTNFHLPKSSLIMLVSALIGREKIIELYKTAVNKKYRFYSFGDAMFITNSKD